MKELKVEVIGSDPPCKRCNLTKENVEKAASRLRASEIEIRITKRNIASPDVAKQYGVLASPAVAVEGVVKIMGKVPEIDELERILKKAASE